MGHHARCRDGDVELDGTTTGNLLGKLLATDDVRTRLFSLCDGSTIHKSGHPDILAGAIGEAYRAANELIGLAGVDAQIEDDVDALVELGKCHATNQFERLFGAVELALVVPLLDGCDVLRFLCHCCTSSGANGNDDPSHIFTCLRAWPGSRWLSPRR